MYFALRQCFYFFVGIPVTETITWILQIILNLIFGPPRSDQLRETNLVFRYDIVLDTKISPAQQTYPKLFLKKFKCVEDISFIDRDDVSLYSFDSSNFIFVRTGVAIDLYDTEKYPFFNMIQHDSAFEVITATHEAVFRYMDSKPTKDGKNVSVLYMTGRCGSTLVSAMVHKTGQAIVISEPNVLGHAMEMCNKIDISISKERKQQIKILRMCLLLLVKDPSKLYFIKLYPIAADSLPHLVQFALPGTTEMFMHRALKPTMISFKKMLGPIGSYFLSNVFVNNLSFKYRQVCKNIKLDNPNTKLIYWFLCVIHAISLEAKQRSDITSYSYESLLNDPKGFCKNILKNVGVSSDYVGLALTALEKDSQANVAPMSKKTLANRRVQLPEEDLRWAKITAMEEFGIDMEDDGVINLPNSWQSF